MSFPIITAIAADISTFAVNHPKTIDFSILDTIVGAVIAIAAMIVVGLVLFKYGVVKLGGSLPESENITAAMEMAKITAEKVEIRANRAEIKSEFNDLLSELKTAIGELREDLKGYAKEHQECQRQLPEKYVQWEIFNRIMDELKKDRKERWGKFDSHGHDSSSGVVLINK